jgi:hypothetical protein
LVVAAFPVTACGSDKGDATSSNTTSGGCVDYTMVSGSVSFKDDDIPIFPRACAFSACHDSSSASPQEDLPLATPANDGPMTAEQITAVHDALVDSDSVRSSLKMVAPGDPGASWLQAKLEFANFSDCAAIRSTCAPKGCGVRMPQNSPALEASEREIIAQWIKAGAKND